MTNNTPTVNNKDISYSPSFMSQIAMFPIKNPGDERFVERTNGQVSVAVMQSIWGWTYGKMPRLFLIYVRSLVQTKSDKVDMENHIVKLDKSFHAFCKEVGLGNGTDLKDVEQSLLCLSGTTFTVSLTGCKPQRETFHGRSQSAARQPLSSAFQQFQFRLSGVQRRWRPFLLHPVFGRDVEHVHRQSGAVEQENHLGTREVGKGFGYLPVACLQDLWLKEAVVYSVAFPQTAIRYGVHADAFL